MRGIRIPAKRRETRRLRANLGSAAFMAPPDLSLPDKASAKTAGVSDQTPAGPAGFHSRVRTSNGRGRWKPEGGSHA